MKASFNAKYYVEAGSFTDPGAISRYALNCIRVEPHPVKGAIIIATNGCILGVWHDEYGSCGAPVLLAYDKALNPLCGVVDNEWEQPQSRVIVVNDDDTVTLANGISADVRGATVGILNGLVESGHFPDWRNVLPKEETPRMDFNPHYIDLFTKLNTRQYPRLALWVSQWNGKAPPAVVKVDEREDFVGVVMGTVESDAKWPGEYFDSLRVSPNGRES